MNRQQTNSFSDDDAVSALVDGALRGDAFADAMGRLADDGEARARWHAYHVVGDVLRSEDLAGCKGDMAFLARLEARLELEPAHAAPLSELQPVAAAVQRPAANSDVFRWKMAAGFASLAAVVAIGWQALQLQGPQALSGAVLAQQSQPAQQQQQQPDIVAVRADASAAPEYSAEPAPVMLRNAQLDELLAAHNRAVGGAALQSQARMLRNVSITEDLAR